jgi:hypothetical protein
MLFLDDDKSDAVQTISDGKKEEAEDVDEGERCFRCPFLLLSRSSLDLVPIVFVCGL